MGDLVKEVFQEDVYRVKLRKKLPYIFKIIDLEFSRGGHVGMEVGVFRERVIVSFFMHVFGEDKVILDTANKAEVDLRIVGHDNPISIKTKTGGGLSGIKLKWTVDWKKAEEFYASYFPTSDMIFVQINWNRHGLFAYIPLNIQKQVFTELGKESYLKLPRKGTNPRGVEISTLALKECLKRTEYKLDIHWKVDESILSKYNPYKRWIELWEEE